MKNLTTTFALSLISSLAITNIAEASPVDMNQLEAEMSSCGYLDDANAMYTRCLQVNHPNHHNGSYERWNARGSICTELVQKHGAPVWYRQDVANDTDRELANSSCVDDYYYLTEEFTQEVVEEMSACEFLTAPDQIYTNCLQLNHPQLHGGDATRWDIRGSICTNVANQYNAPISYRQDVANAADQKLATSECYDWEPKYVTDLVLTEDQNDCPTGYDPVSTRAGARLNGDLNQGGGGKFIYLCQRREVTTPDNAISHLLLSQAPGKYSGGYYVAEKAKKALTDAGATIVTGSRSSDLNGDLNQGMNDRVVGTRTGWIFLGYKKDAPSYDKHVITNIVLQESPICADGEQGPKLFGSNGDLNQNDVIKEGGRDIYICAETVTVH